MRRLAGWHRHAAPSGDPGFRCFVYVYVWVWFLLQTLLLKWKRKKKKSKWLAPNSWPWFLPSVDWGFSKFDNFLFLELRGGRRGVLSVCTMHVQDVHSGIFCRLRKTHSRVLFKTGALAIPRGSSGLGSSFHSLLVPFLVGELRSLKLRRPEKNGGGAWWAAVYGVAQSQTRLKRLSSSWVIWQVTKLSKSFTNSH